MDASAFWNVISQYNQQTFWIQIVLFCILLLSVIISYKTKHSFIAKITLGVLNLFIGIGFFFIYGTEPIHKFFALPLYIAIGILFFVEAFRNKADVLNKPSLMSIILMSLYLLYPFVSMIFGGRYPRMVSYIMPCPVITASIAIYCNYNKKNPFLILLMAIWGLTGIKAFIFNAYEDSILFMAGIYAVILLVGDMNILFFFKNKIFKNGEDQ